MLISVACCLCNESTANLNISHTRNITQSFGSWNKCFLSVLLLRFFKIFKIIFKLSIIHHFSLLWGTQKSALLLSVCTVTFSPLLDSVTFPVRVQKHIHSLLRTKHRKTEIEVSCLLTVGNDLDRLWVTRRMDMKMFNMHSQSKLRFFEGTVLTTGIPTRTSNEKA